ncbi:MAG TPA: fumarylacetoacetate hydrolase family protein [Hyphomicrobiaceae bacterium]|nr:fumarylacetoacetate hydrolase family protein [Hyphomicrobiaceae bacterium]
MKLMAFEKGTATALGLVEGETVLDLGASGDAVPTDLLRLIAAGPSALEAIKSSAARAPASARLALSAIKPALPIARPPKFICVGLNYALHAKEGGHPMPTYPSFFLRVPTSLTAPGAPVIKPKCSIQLDYECELAIVIGKGGRHIPEKTALEHVFGYTLFNDVSVRDYQRKTTQWTAGKNFDSTGPVGPWVVTPDELPPGASGLRIQTRVNGEIMQDSNTADMIFDTVKLIAILSEFMTLEPGDMIATGTPSGVAHARKPPAWMKAGDTVEVELEGIGVLRNPIVDEA